MNVNHRPSTRPSLEPHHRHFIELQNHCPLCGHQLKITAESYLENFTLKEQAYCSQCDVTTRVKDHKMH